MADLLFDFAEPIKASLFPQHGWATNSQGIKILWCPLQRLLSSPQQILEAKGRSTRTHPGITHSLPFLQTLSRLAIALRELHKIVRLSCNHDANDPSSESANAFHQTNEMAPLYIELAFVYLRRLPDLLVTACSPLLFEHVQSVPQKYKDWIVRISDFKSLSPLCDLNVLSKAIVNHSGWFNALRGTSPSTGKKGIRDTLEHRPVHFIVTKNQTGKNQPRIEVILDSRASDVDKHRDILPQITEAVAGLCFLMTGIHSSIGIHNQYEWGDQLMLVGNDQDIVGYWPQIDV